jgi:hypothetical protein
MRRTFLIATAFLACAALAPAMGVEAASATRKARLEACSGKSPGDACSYTNAKGTEVDGTCGTTKRGKLLCKKGSGMSGSTGDSMGGGAAGGSEAPPAAGGDEAPPPNP